MSELILYQDIYEDGTSTITEIIYRGESIAKTNGHHIDFSVLKPHIDKTISLIRRYEGENRSSRKLYKLTDIKPKAYDTYIGYELLLDEF